jgi:hypothetical protein
MRHRGDHFVLEGRDSVSGSIRGDQYLREKQTVIMEWMLMKAFVRLSQVPHQPDASNGNPFLSCIIMYRGYDPGGR